jgi:hypothetical protein
VRSTPPVGRYVSNGVTRDKSGRWALGSACRPID